MIRPREEIINELVSTNLTQHQLTLLVQLLAALPSQSAAPSSDWMEKDRQRSQRYRDNRRANGMKTYFRGEKYRPDLMRRDGAMCIYCGTNPGTDFDHILPIRQGGTDDLDNLGLACRPCNSGKSGRTPDEARMTFASRSAQSAYQRYLAARNRADGARQNADDMADDGADDVRPPLILSSFLSSEKRTTEEVSKEERKKETRAKRKPAVPLPADWQPKPAHYAKAKALGRPDGFVESKAEDLRIWAQSNDARKQDWDATFHGFIRRDNGVTNGQRTQTRTVQDSARALAARARENLDRFNKPVPGDSGIRDGAGGPDVRLLSKG